MVSVSLALLPLACVAVDEQNPAQVLVIGDSLSAQSVWVDFTSNALDAAGVEVAITLEAYGGWSWGTHTQNLAALTGAQYDRIVVLLGTNDRFPGSPVEVTLAQSLADAATVLDTVRASSPEACVLVLTLPGPADGSSAEWIARHSAYNAALLELDDARTDVLPLHELVASDRFRDAVHLHRDAEYAIAAAVTSWLLWRSCK